MMGSLKQEYQKADSLFPFHSKKDQISLFLVNTFIPFIWSTSDAVDYKPFLQFSKHKSIPTSIRCDLLNEKKSW